MEIEDWAGGSSDSEVSSPESDNKDPCYAYGDLPRLQYERERIYTSGGSVCESDDEPGVSRIRASIDETSEGPGLTLSRVFGDFFVKDFGLISNPDVIQRTLTTRDHLVILATDGRLSNPIMSLGGIV